MQKEIRTLADDSPGRPLLPISLNTKSYEPRMLGGRLFAMCLAPTSARGHIAEIWDSAPHHHPEQFNAKLKKTGRFEYN